MIDPESTTPETPQAKRLSVPDFSLPEDPTPMGLAIALSDILFQLGENLKFLRMAAERRQLQDEANDVAIRQLEEKMRNVERRLTALEGEVRQT